MFSSHSRPLGSMTARSTGMLISHPPNTPHLPQNQRRRLLRRHILQLTAHYGPRRQPQRNSDHQRDERSRSPHARRTRNEEQRKELNGENAPSQREVLIKLVRRNGLGHLRHLPGARNL